MKRIGLIGYGILGQQIEFFLNEEYNQDIEFYYFDDEFYKAGKSNFFRFYDYSKAKFKDLEYYVCMGYKNLVLKNEIIEDLLRRNFILPSFVHSSAYVSPLSRIELGVLVFPLCNIGQNVVIKSGAILHNSVTISHSSCISECCYLAPSVTLSGNVIIGRQTFLGTSAAISTGITIGENVKIGIGSVVTRNIKNNTSCIGNPVRKINNLNLL